MPARCEVIPGSRFQRARNDRVRLAMVGFAALYPPCGSSLLPLLVFIRELAQAGRAQAAAPSPPHTSTGLLDCSRTRFRKLNSQPDPRGGFLSDLSCKVANIRRGFNVGFITNGATMIGNDYSSAVS